MIPINARLNVLKLSLLSWLLLPLSSGKCPPLLFLTPPKPLLSLCPIQNPHTLLERITCKSEEQRKQLFGKNRKGTQKYCLVSQEERA